MVGVPGILVLFFPEEQNTDRAPEGGITAVADYGLVIGFMSFVVFLTDSIGTTKKVPGLGVVRV